MGLPERLQIINKLILAELERVLKDANELWNFHHEQETFHHQALQEQKEKHSQLINEHMDDYIKALDEAIIEVNAHDIWEHIPIEQKRTYIEKVKEEEFLSHLEEALLRDNIKNAEQNIQQLKYEMNYIQGNGKSNISQQTLPNSSQQQKSGRFIFSKDLEAESSKIAKNNPEFKRRHNEFQSLSNSNQDDNKKLKSLLENGYVNHDKIAIEVFGIENVRNLQNCGLDFKKIMGRGNIVKIDDHVNQQAKPLVAQALQHQNGIDFHGKQQIKIENFRKQVTENQDERLNLPPTKTSNKDLESF